MVHRHDPVDAVRRTVTRATRPALAPLRAAAASFQVPVASGHREDGPGDTGVDAVRTLDDELDELSAMRDELSVLGDADDGQPTDRAARATRSASAYLEARRARLKRELRDLDETR